MATDYTSTKRCKGKHLTLGDRTFLAHLLNEGRSISYIAEQLGCARGTIYNELQRGTVNQIIKDKDRLVYFPETGQAIYEMRRKHCHRVKFSSCGLFICEVLTLMKERSWSIDATIGALRRQRRYPRNRSVCTRTMYKYVDMGLFSDMKNIDLPQKCRRRSRKDAISRKHKRCFGDSIELRDTDVHTRTTFGHWEMDTVIGTKDTGSSVVLTLAERKTRFFIATLIPNKTAYAVNVALRQLLQQWHGNISHVFKSITTDNGSEFSRLYEIQSWLQENEGAHVDIYYAHPYSAFERGTNERHNGMLRRFLPKGRSFERFSLQDIEKMGLWCNALPRKILQYRTPSELFDDEIMKLGALGV